MVCRVIPHHAEPHFSCRLVEGFEKSKQENGLSSSPELQETNIDIFFCFMKARPQAVNAQLFFNYRVQFGLFGIL